MGRSYRGVAPLLEKEKEMFVQDLPVPHQDGSWVSERISRVVDLIREYDHRLDVRWIRPADREPGDAAFAIIELTPDGPRTAFLVQTEDEFDERVLARIYAADGAKSDPVARMDALNKAAQALRKREREEAWEELADKTKFLMRTPLWNPRIDGRRMDLFNDRQ